MMEYHIFIFSLLSSLFVCTFATNAKLNVGDLQSVMVGKSYWEQHLSHVNIPHVLQNLMSPLTFVEPNSLKLEFETSSKVLDFCTAAGILCGDVNPASKVGPYPWPDIDPASKVGPYPWPDIDPASKVGPYPWPDIDPASKAGPYPWPDIDPASIDRTSEADDNILVQNAIDIKSTFVGEPNAREKLVWFLEKDLISNIGTPKAFQVPASKFVSDLVVTPRQFLPRSITTQLGKLTVNNLPNILQKFHIETNSLLGQATHETARLCEQLPSTPTNEASSNVAKKQCITSFEDMTDFIGSLVPQGSKLVSVEALNTIKPPSKEQILGHGNFTVTNVELKGNNDYTIIANCHSPYSVYRVELCHSMDFVRPYTITLESSTQSSGKITTVAMCHGDTSNWNPHHLAFKILGSHPGGAAICHWAEPNDIQLVLHVDFK